MIIAHDEATQPAPEIAILTSPFQGLVRHLGRQSDAELKEWIANLYEPSPFTAETAMQKVADAAVKLSKTRALSKANPDSQLLRLDRLVAEVEYGFAYKEYTDPQGSKTYA